MKAYKHEIEMRCMDVHIALETMELRSFDESVAVEFGTLDNLGGNQFRYKYDSLSYNECSKMQKPRCYDFMP